MISSLKKDFQKISNPQKAKILSRFFKTGAGEYGEGDIFLGITVPEQRKIAKKYYKDATIGEIDILLKDKIHEYRLTALLVLMLKNKKASQEVKKEYFDYYLKNATYINSWDLVDVTCRDIVGEYLVDKKRDILYKLARSKNLWEKRISIISTYAYIRRNDFKDTLKIAEILLFDKHDLIQKAVGWMLREVGKRDEKEEELFLNKYYKVMPRTTLRYAIEKFNDKKRKFYLKK